MFLRHYLVSVAVVVTAVLVLVVAYFLDNCRLGGARYTIRRDDASPRTLQPARQCARGTANAVRQPLTRRVVAQPVPVITRISVARLVAGNSY